MKTVNNLVALVALLAVTVFVACEKNEQLGITPSAESTKIGINSINVSKMAEHSLLFDINVDENGEYKAYFENKNGSIRFGIGNIEALFENGILTLKEDDSIINVVNFHEKTKTGEVSYEQNLLIGRFVNSLLDISDEKYKFKIENNSSTSLRSATDSKCNLNWSRRRAVRSIKKSIDKEGGCPQGQTLDIDCLCGATDYLCVCCGDCG